MKNTIREMILKLGVVHESASRMTPPPNEMPSVIPTLDVSVSIKITPQILDRFITVDRWENAFCGQTLLGIKDLQASPVNATVAELFESRISCWPNSPVAKASKKNISLFSVNSDQSEEVYFIWGGREPIVVSYIGNFEKTYRNLLELLQDYSNL